MDDLTVLSAAMLDQAGNMDLSLSEAVRYLKETAKQRTVSEVLKKFTDNPSMSNISLKQLLTDRLKELLPEANSDSIRKNISNWLKEDSFSVSKKNAIQLAFALNLSLEQTDDMLMLLCKERFHCREREDIIYCYALSNRLSYSDALRLIDETSGLVSMRRKEDRTFVFTSTVRNSVERLHSEQELIIFLTSSIDVLDRLHNTAFSFFSGFMKLLQTPSTNGYFADAVSKKALSTEIDKAFTAKDVVKQYMFSDFIPRVSKKHPGKEQESCLSSAMQRMIHQNWPDETVISRMTSREIDVSRKVLILLFLATDGGYSEYGSEDDPYANGANYMSSAYGDYLDEVSVEERFKEAYWRLNAMLYDCGFAEIDPRNEFDWMVLYCMCSEENLEIDEKMKQFLSAVFSERSV